MAERVRVREITNDEGNRLLRTVRRSSGSVVTWRRAQMVLLSAQGMDVPAIATVTFTSPDRVRDVLHNFNADGFDSLKPRYAGGRPPKFDLAQRAEIRKIALGRPADHGLPFATLSLSKLADFLVAEGVVEDKQSRGAAGAAARGRPAPTRTTRPRRIGCWSYTRSPTAWSSPGLLSDRCDLRG